VACRAPRRGVVWCGVGKAGGVVSVGLFWWWTASPSCSGYPSRASTGAPTRQRPAVGCAGRPRPRERRSCSGPYCGRRTPPRLRRAGPTEFPLWTPQRRSRTVLLRAIIDHQGRPALGAGAAARSSHTANPAADQVRTRGSADIHTNARIEPPFVVRRSTQTAGVPSGCTESARGFAQDAGGRP
jgi:hypothetical protein